MSGDHMKYIEFRTYDFKYKKNQFKFSLNSY